MPALELAKRQYYYYYGNVCPFLETIRLISSHGIIGMMLLKRFAESVY